MNRFSEQAREDVIASMKRLRGMSDVQYLLHLTAYHAAPTLLGIKPATLVCPDSARADLPQALKECVPCLARIFGVKVADFRNRAGALLYLVYQPALLQSVLAAEDVVRLLADLGYDVAAADAETLLSRLRRNFSDSRFPHEIGVFLGYPAEDVRRFMADGGRGCGAVGCWKAYGDAERVRRCSARYRRLKQHVAALIAAGHDLQGIVDGLRLLAA